MRNDIFDELVKFGNEILEAWVFVTLSVFMLILYSAPIWVLYLIIWGLS